MSNATQPSRIRRLIKWMTTPGRLLAGIPAAWIIAWFDYGHRVTFFNWMICYGCWFIALFILFWLYELHAGAGGKHYSE